MAKITNVGVHIVESADAIGDIAGEGQIWVDNQTPNQLKFTDDAGTDFGLSPSFISSEQTVAVDTKLDVAHSLGVVPTFFQVVLRCKTGEDGYGVGDDIFVPFGLDSNAADRGVAVLANSSNVEIITSSSLDVVAVDDFDAAALTPSNFKWIVRCWV